MYAGTKGRERSLGWEDPFRFFDRQRSSSKYGQIGGVYLNLNQSTSRSSGNAPRVLLVSRMSSSGKI